MKNYLPLLTNIYIQGGPKKAEVLKIEVPLSLLLYAQLLHLAGTICFDYSQHVDAIIVLYRAPLTVSG